jgi:hypothetical protein
MKTCCRPGESFRTWITALKDTVGIDDEEERERARDRYLLALKPMKQPTNWDTWLIEYDHAASTAEAEKVAEVQNIQDVMRDFLRAIMKVAPTWEVTFCQMAALLYYLDAWLRNYSLYQHQQMQRHGQ